MPRRSVSQVYTCWPAFSLSPRHPSNCGRDLHTDRAWNSSPLSSSTCARPYTFGELGTITDVPSRSSSPYPLSMASRTSFFRLSSPGPCSKGKTASGTSVLAERRVVETNACAGSHLRARHDFVILRLAGTSGQSRAEEGRVGAPYGPASPDVHPPPAEACRSKGTRPRLTTPQPEARHHQTPGWRICTPIWRCVARASTSEPVAAS
jgi:hypothetical protein